MKKSKKIKRYIVNHYCVDGIKKEQSTFPMLLAARKFANDTNRQDRFISLTNIKGVFLTI